MSISKRLLILDDEPNVAKTLEILAKKLGFSVKKYIEAEPFFECLEQWHPSHIALDLVMPGMDGIEVLHRLSRQRTSAQIILTSGVGDRVLEAARLSAGNHGLHLAGILPKPFKAEALRKLLMQESEIEANILLKVNTDAALVISNNDVEDALANCEFETYLQPKISLPTKKVVAFEALVRWNHPSKGLISPDLFIPIVEREGKIEELTYEVIRQGMTWLRSISEEYGTGIALQINLSAVLLKDISLADKFSALSQEFGIATNRITFEITETAAITNSKLALDILTRLRLKGFELAIDDFGTGYSSISQLSQLPFTELKIDKTFIHAVRHSNDARHIVQHTIGLAKNLGLYCVAEGVEDKWTVDYLENLNCEWAQGYYISKPMSPVESSLWLRHRA